MSRRSILLATTFYVAIGSLTAIGPASAHSFGGFGGGPDGVSGVSRMPAYHPIPLTPIQSTSNPGRANFGHVPAIGGPAAAGNIPGPRVEPARVPMTLSALANTSSSALSARPAQLPPAITSSGIAVHQTIDAAGIVTAPNRVGAAGIVSRPATSGLPSKINSTETEGKLPKPGGSEGVSNVTGAPKVVGQGPTPEHGPNSSGAKNDGPIINLPGAEEVGAKGPRQVPGYGSATSGPQLNLPGSVDRHGPDGANKALSKAESNDKQLLDEADRGGPNSVNTPTSPGTGVDVSDDTNGKKPGSTGGGKTAGSGGSSTSAGSGSSGGSGVAVAPGVIGSNGSGTTKDGNTQTVSTMHEGDTTYQVVTVKNGEGKIVSMTYSEKKDGSSKIITKSTGPEIPNGTNKKTPNDDESTGTIGSLNPGSGVGKTGNGGGTDNNSTETTVKGSQLANGTSLGRTGNGDGTGTHGDNNGVDKSGALAGGTSLARKDYGDGGGSDNRDGGTSLGAPRVGSGGDPHQKAAAASASHN